MTSQYQVPKLEGARRPSTEPDQVRLASHGTGGTASPLDDLGVRSPRPSTSKSRPTNGSADVVVNIVNRAADPRTDKGHPDIGHHPGYPTSWSPIGPML